MEDVKQIQKAFHEAETIRQFGLNNPELNNFNLGAERAEREVPSLKSGDESEPSPSLRSNFKQ